MLGDKSYNLGAIVARRLHHNRFNGDFFGVIYATRLADFLGVTILMMILNCLLLI